MKKTLLGSCLILAPLGLLGQSATVEVTDTFDPIPEETPTVPIDLLNGSPLGGGHLVGATGGGSLSGSTSSGGCTHARVRFQPSGSVGFTWVNPRQGEQIFYCAFTNKTHLDQSFTQEVRRSITSTFDGSLNLEVACAKVGVSVQEEVKQTFPVQVPAHGRVTLTAFAVLMDRGIEMMTVCNACNEVLAAKFNWVTAGRGVNGTFE